MNNNIKIYNLISKPMLLQCTVMHFKNEEPLCCAFNAAYIHAFVNISKKNFP